MEHQRMISHRLVGVSLGFSPVVPTSNITRDQIVKDLIPQWNSMGSHAIFEGTKGGSGSVAPCTHMA